MLTLVAKPAEISTAAHSAATNGLDLANLPCFVDAVFGTRPLPILYYRQAYKWDAEVALNAGNNKRLCNQDRDGQSGTTGHACYYANTNVLIDKAGSIPTVCSTPPIPLLDAFVTDNVNGVATPKSVIRSHLRRRRRSCIRNFRRHHRLGRMILLIRSAVLSTIEV